MTPGIPGIFILGIRDFLPLGYPEDFSSPGSVFFFRWMGYPDKKPTPLFINLILRSETQMTSSLHLSRTSTLWPTKSTRSLSIVIRLMWTTETLAENSSIRQLTTLDGVVDKNTISSYLYSNCHILAFLLNLSDQKIMKKIKQATEPSY